MRIPGTWHYKEEPLQVILEYLEPTNRYDYKQFSFLLKQDKKAEKIPTGNPTAMIEWFKSQPGGKHDNGAYRIGIEAAKMNAANSEFDMQAFRESLERIWREDWGKSENEFASHFENGLKDGKRSLEEKPPQLKGKELFKAADESLRGYFEGRLRFNTRTGFPELDGGPVEEVQLWREYNMQDETVFIADKAKFRDLLHAFALDNSYDPFLEYLQGLTPKQPEILHNLATKLFGLTESEDRVMANIYLTKTLIAAIARTFNPGTKVDTVLILQSGQGAGKTTLWNILAGSLYVSKSAKNLSGSDKDTLMQMHMGVIVDLSEIDLLFSSSDNESIKDFTSTSIDQFRKPYDALPRQYPRRFILVGTSNREELLNDPTGDRRFWIISTEKDKHNPIDIDFVKENKDQIWAEAVWLYQNGEKWWLNPDEEEWHDKRNAKYRKTDVWQEYFNQAKPLLTGENYDPSTGKVPAFTLGALIEGLIGESKRTMQKGVQNRLKDLLTANGFVVVRKGRDGSKVFVPKELANVDMWRVGGYMDVVKLAQLCGHDHIAPAKDDNYSEPVRF
jgi:predicted P-loop ATPase